MFNGNAILFSQFLQLRSLVILLVDTFNVVDRDSDMHINPLFLFLLPRLLEIGGVRGFASRRARLPEYVVGEVVHLPLGDPCNLHGLNQNLGSQT